jgi:hypothetical protein
VTRNPKNKGNSMARPPVRHRTRHAVLLVIGLAASAASLPAQPDQKPLKNADVIAMTKSGLQESTIIGAIQANPTEFDVSASGLIALQQVGVSAKIMDAMLSAAAANRKPPAGTTTPDVTTGPGTHAGTPPVPGQPSVALLQSGSRQAVETEKSQLAQTKSKATSLGGLASDGVLNQTLRAGVNTAVWEAWTHTGSTLGGTAISETGSIVGGMMARRSSSKVTYVWALPAPHSTTQASTTPAFEVSVAGVAGVKADEYAPAIVKLAPTPNDWRLVGATEGKQDTMTNPALEWPVYSSFIEDRVPAQIKNLAPGSWQISVAGPLAPGEYGVVIRPLSRNKKFAGQDVGRSQGDGLLFNSVWSFAVK